MIQIELFSLSSRMFVIFKCFLMVNKGLNVWDREGKSCEKIDQRSGKVCWGFIRPCYLVCFLVGQTSVEEIVKQRSLWTYEKNLLWRIKKKRIHRNQRKEHLRRQRKGPGLLKGRYIHYKISHQIQFVKIRVVKIIFPHQRWKCSCFIKRTTLV